MGEAYHPTRNDNVLYQSWGQAPRGLCPIWRSIARVDCRHEMLLMTFLDPGAFPIINFESADDRRRDSAA